MLPEADRKVVKQYTCKEYRDEMVLLALQYKLQHASTTAEQERISREIARLEKEMGF